MRLRIGMAGTLIAMTVGACQPEVAGTAVPAGYARADFVPETLAAQLPPGLSRNEVLERDGCYYMRRNGAAVPIPWTERNPATGATQTVEIYCIG